MNFAKASFIHILVVAALAMRCTASATSEDPNVQEITHKVFLDINIADKYEGRIVIGLFGKVAKITANNFYGIATEQIPGLTYKGTSFHRIIPSFMIQGGDTDNANGRGGRSIYGAKFDDEEFTVHHTQSGLLAMANSGPNSNGSQFFITVVKTPWLDNKHVVFGTVLEGMDIVTKVEAVGTRGGEPTKPVVIVNCGGEELERPIEM